MCMQWHQEVKSSLVIRMGLRIQVLAWSSIIQEMCSPNQSDVEWAPEMPGFESWFFFTNVSRALQDIFSKLVYCRNRTSYELKFCTCAQSHAFGTRTKFQLEIPTINVNSGIVYFREIILESSRKVTETTLRSHHRKTTLSEKEKSLFDWKLLPMEELKKYIIYYVYHWMSFIFVIP